MENDCVLLTPSEQKKAEAKRRGNIAVKAYLQLGLAVFAALVLLLGTALTYQDGSVTVPLSGIHVLKAVFYGNKLGYLLYGKLIWITVPWYVTAALIISLASLATLITLTAVQMLARKKNSRAVAFAGLGTGAFCLLYYVLLLVVPGFSAQAASGETVPFYRLFEISVSVLLGGTAALFAGCVQLFLAPARVDKVKKYWVFYVILIVPTAFILAFCLYPILLQLILSFKNYTLEKGVWGSDWAGFGNFAYLFSDPQMLRVIWNTVYLSFLRLLAGLIPPIIFAVVFYDMGAQRYRKVVQTIVYIPHFFSWVIIYAIVTAFLTPDGIVNNLLVNFFNGEAIDFLSKPNLFYLNMILSSVWKEVGWGTILYLAALSGIDRTLYEAASIDGAGAMRKLWSVTLPGMIPIIVFQAVMAVGNLLKGAGGEQILIFATGSVKNDKALVIDTWLYWQGLGELKYGLSAAVSFVQAALGFVMVIASHKLSKRLVGIGAW